MQIEMDIIDSQLKIPQIETVDFTDAIAVSDFGHMLFAAYRNAGGFVSGKGKKLLEIERIAQQYVSKVAGQMSGASANYIMRYLSWYDMVHRVGLHIPAPTSFLTKWMEEAFQRYWQGEKCDSTFLLNLIASHDKRLSSTLNAKVLNWAKKAVKVWDTEFKNGILFIKQ